MCQALDEGETRLMAVVATRGDSNWTGQCLALQQTAKCLSEAENVTEFRLQEHGLSQKLIYNEVQQIHKSSHVAGHKSVSCVKSAINPSVQQTTRLSVRVSH